MNSLTLLAPPPSRTMGFIEYLSTQVHDSCPSRCYESVAANLWRMTDDMDLRRQPKEAFCDPECSKAGGLAMVEPCRVYRRRWRMLALFVLCSMCNASHWLQYSIITNIVMRYYGVGNLAVNWTSMIYMASYVTLVLPASWLLDKKGLRITLLCGVVLMTIGAWIKVASASPDRFIVTFIGQALVGGAQIFILGVPARLAAVWFGPEQVSTACSIGVFGNQVGIALGFLFPPALVGNHESLDDIGQDLYHLYIGMAVAPTIVLVLICLLFEDAPPLPPSPAQANIHQQLSKDTFLQSLKKLVTNFNFILLLVSYGINIGVFYAVSTLLNQVVLTHFENAEADGGRIGLTMVFCGVVGSVLGGIVLDKTHRFKETTVAVYFLALLGMVFFTFTISMGYISLVYLTAGFLGFFITGYLGIGYEFAVELTYPVSEGTSSGLLNTSSEVCGVIFTTIAGELFVTYGDYITNIALTSVLVVGLFMSLFIRGSDLKRQAVCQKVVSKSCSAEQEMLTTPA